MINKKGVALVIANSAYITQPKLKSCKKDGEDMRGALERLNFDVFFAENQNRAELFNIISEFLKNADLYSTVLLYYTGHGVQIDGENYFVPIDCTYNPIKAIFVATQLVGMRVVQDYMDAHPEKNNIMILDACRSEPGFARDIVGTGLAEMKAGSGTFVAFATAPNKTAGCAADENGNGFYTECLLRHIEQPNIKIEDMFKEVRKDVIALTKGAQIPWENTSLKNDFYFNIMTRDQIDDWIYKTVRNAYSAETLIDLSIKIYCSISDVMRIYNRQKSEKPGGIYFNSDDEFEKFILRQVLNLGFTFDDYRWKYKGNPVVMGEFYHTSSFASKS